VKLYIFIHNEFRDFDKNSTQPEIRVNRVQDNESQLYIVAVLLIIIVASVAAIATTTTYALQHLFVMLKICPFDERICHDRMVVGFTTTYALNAYQH
jgi:hypothetical protein